MKIDIWSDVMCPYCYIGKRRLEAALARFSQRKNLQINWHSFQLDPFLETQPGKDIYEYLGEVKRQTRDRSIQLLKPITQTANEEGLSFNFDEAVMANSFDAHRLIQLLKTHDLSHVAEETTFQGLFH